jgi:hypothetical protein
MDETEVNNLPKQITAPRLLPHRRAFTIGSIHASEDVRGREEGWEAAAQPPAAGSTAEAAPKAAAFFQRR